MILDNLILGISKVFDEDDRAFGLRAAIAQLPDALKGSPKSLRKEIHDRRMRLIDAFDQLKKKFEPITAHRNNRVAHNSRARLTGADFPGISRAMMREAMTHLSDLCNSICEARGESQWLFTAGAEMDMSGPCGMLFKVLDAGNTRLDEQTPHLMNLRRGVVPDGLGIKDFSDT